MLSRNKGIFSSEILVPLVGFIISAVVIHIWYTVSIRPAAEDFQIANRVRALNAGEEGFKPQRSLAVIMKDPEQEIEMILWVWATILLTWKLVQVAGERKLLKHDFVGARPGERIIPEEALDRYKELKNSVDATPRWRDRLLPDFLLAALHRFHATRSVHDASSAVKDRAELVADNLDSTLSLIRYVAWAIPAVGFIGTVRGIGDALAQADRAIKGDLTGVTDSLGLAFNSTLVALVLSMILMFMLHALQARQEALILELQNYCREKLVDIMKVPTTEETSQLLT
ncbi:MAG TPA: MotA/TolQ/ExbB proton channel family protein [Opitutaceae bacterium]|nr:MotA/TolQ/ExbB proton channel family protein [Opitutaceae bacterium]